jgi:hypothetical protein
MREPISRKGTREATRSRRFLYLSGCSITAITPLRPHRPQHLSRPADNPLPSLLEVRTKFERLRSAARSQGAIHTVRLYRESAASLGYVTAGDLSKDETPK